MKTKTILRDFQINNVPLEKIVYDVNNLCERCVFVDDIYEKRWRIKLIDCLAIKITNVDFINDKNFILDDFCLRDGCFHRHIMEIENSIWIDELRQIAQNNYSTISGVRHYVLPLYENWIEVIAMDIQIEPV